MFWIGLLVGLTVGVVGLTVIAIAYCEHRYGSWEDFGDGIDLIKVAVDNRESELLVIHDGELLDKVVFEAE